MTDKLHKAFLLMLSATSSGEVVAARNAVVRLAQTRKHDVHSLARALDLGRTPRGGASAKDGENLDTAVMAYFCWEMFERGAHLSEKEQKFVDDMIDWRKPTQKQIDWLKSIYERLKRAGNA
jgi:hypothetical protein